MTCTSRTAHLCPRSRLSTGRLLRWAGSAIFAVLLLAGTPLCEATEPSREFLQETAPEPYVVQRVVHYSFTLQNANSAVVDDGEFWVAAPIRRTATQWCRRIATSHPATLHIDDAGGQTLHFQLGQIAPYGVVIVRIEAELMLAETPVSRREDLDAYRRPSEGVESDEPDIVQLARTLVASDATKTARRISDWVADHVKDAGYTAGMLGALEALKLGRGDCTEQACLFAALCRADGIPARVLGGYICDRNCVFDPALFHNWAEFHDGTTWRVADPNQRLFDEGQANYLATQVVGSESENAPLRGFPRYRVAGSGLQARMD